VRQLLTEAVALAAGAGGAGLLGGGLLLAEIRRLLSPASTPRIAQVRRWTRGSRHLP
jgi:hypothetical protein